MMCHQNEDVAIERGLDGGHFFGYSLGHYYAFGQHKPGKTDIWQEFQERRSQMGFDRGIASQTGQVLGAQMLERGIGSLRGAIGTPEQLRELIRGYQAAGVDTLIFVSQAGKNKHEDICESMELFAKEVMPEFQDGEEARQKEKLERLAPSIEAALARRDAPRTADENYVVSPLMRA